LSARRHSPQDLLNPDLLDRLPLIGVGFSARVLGWGPYAVKVAHPNRRARNFNILKREPGIAKLYAVAADRTALVRQLFRIPTLYQLLLEGNGEIPDRAFEGVWPLYQLSEELRTEQELRLDFSPSNVFVDQGRGRAFLADLGLRLDPPLYPDHSSAELRQALSSYPEWRARLDAPGRLRPFLLPPSGRFHAEVQTGRAPGARLLWVNEGLQLRMGVDWSKSRIELMGSWATHAPEKKTEHLSSRYQDAPGTGAEHAQGDGRVIYLGTVEGGAYGQRELMLKGCGPTPLAWHRHEFHCDGFVSFQRTLWETSICDELRVQGFETPEVLALNHTGRTTVDNTRIEWPAAAAIRVCDTHFRLGHLHRWVKQPGALKALCQQMGRLVLRADFDPERPGHLVELVLNFAHNLGYDTGRSDALNIHCFNPTMGNLRVDGHFIDFSTIRFHRHYVPDYIYLDGKRRVREHRAVLRRHVASFAGLLQQAGLLTKPQVQRLTRRGLRLFDDRYDDGYLDGLGRFLGYSDLELRPGQRKILVSETVHLRALRASAELDFPFWKQRHPAPLFDLEGQAPEFVRAWSRGEPQPWRALRSEFYGEVTPFAKHVATSWLDLIERAIPPRSLRALRPRRFEEIVRPFMEVNSLAELCYHRSTPDEFTEWKRLIATSRHLPEGRYTYLESRSEALRLGHVVLSGVRPHRYEVVVGVTEELHEAICDLLDDAFGDRLLGGVATGMRVMTRARLRQACPGVDGVPAGGDRVKELGLHPRHSSPLDLRAFVRSGELPRPRHEIELELGAKLLALGARFPLTRFDPPRLPVYQTDSHDLPAALAEYTAVPRGRHTIFAEQTVWFYGPEEGRPSDPVGEVCRVLPAVDEDDTRRVGVAELIVPENLPADLGCPLTLHQLEMCLRDRIDVEPPAPLVEQRGDGRFEVRAFAGAVLATSRAGREKIAVKIAR